MVCVLSPRSMMRLIRTASIRSRREGSGARQDRQVWPERKGSIDQFSGRQVGPQPVQHLQGRICAAFVGVQHLDLQYDLVTAEGPIGHQIARLPVTSAREIAPHLPRRGRRRQKPRTGICEDPAPSGLILRAQPGGDGAAALYCCEGRIAHAHFQPAQLPLRGGKGEPHGSSIRGISRIGAIFGENLVGGRRWTQALGDGGAKILAQVARNVVGEQRGSPRARRASLVDRI